MDALPVEAYKRNAMLPPASDHSLPSTLMSTDCHAATAQEAQAWFAEVAEAEATHLAFAPGRVNLIGEHTDYNGGFVLPLAIDRGIYMAGRLRDDAKVRVWSAEQPGTRADFHVDMAVPRGAPPWSNYVRGVVAGFQQAGLAVPGFDAAIYANLPEGGGLSSSAALELATATLVEAMAGVTLPPEQKALLCQRAEHDFAGTPCGIMDQFAVTFGQRGHLLLIDCRTQRREPVPMPSGETSILVINTMVKHALTDGGYAQRRADCHEAARWLGVPELRDVTPAEVEAARPRLPERLFRRARHVTTENDRTLDAVEALRRGAWERLGGMMYASHASLRDDFDVSCSELDAVVSAARGLGLGRGVYGCRMTGGGFGGCCVALVQTGRAREIGETIRTRYREVTGISPTIFVTQPGDGCAILRQP
jgi:galactokinase